MNGLTEGRIVHYVMPDSKHRPAIVVQVWRVQDYENDEVVGLPHSPENGCCNLQVFTDGSNDALQLVAQDGKSASYITNPEAEKGIVWKTSVLYSKEPKPYTWHWVEPADSDIGKANG